MSDDRLKKYEDFISMIDDKIRVLNLELVKPSDVTGFWVYHIVYFEEEQIKEDHVMGKDMSDALYRFSQILELPQSRFSSKFFKK